MTKGDPLRTLPEEKFFQLSLDLLIIGYPTGFPKKMSPSWSRTLGWSMDELYQTHVSNLIHPDDFAATVDVTMTMLNGKEVVSFENRFKHKNGSYRWLLWTSLYSPEDELIYGIAKDMTDIKKMREDLSLTQKRLAGAQRMESIGRLAGGIAHDFNNMLASIIGNLEMVEREFSQDHRAQRYIASISKTAARAAALTKQLMTFGRHQVVSSSVQNLNTLAGEALQMIASLLKENVETSLKTSIVPLSIVADPSQIIQVIMNLAINAGDAMPDGGVLEISIDEFRLNERDLRRPEVNPGRYARLGVRDSGVGMDSETLERIFEPFFTTKKLKGTGLGLSIVYGIVKQVGGLVFVSSEVGLGTTFEILIPTVEGSKAEMVSHELNEKSPSGEGRCIFVVEDEPDLRLILCETLEADGYRVLTAEDGAEAAQMLDGAIKHIDLLLSDVTLPGMSGYDLVKIVRGLRIDMPIILMSGYLSHELPNFTLPKDIELVAKPFHFSDLLLKIDRLLRIAAK